MPWKCSLCIYVSTIHSYKGKFYIVSNLKYWSVLYRKCIVLFPSNTNDYCIWQFLLMFNTNQASFGHSESLCGQLFYWFIICCLFSTSACSNEFYNIITCTEVVLRKKTLHHQMNIIIHRQETCLYLSKLFYVIDQKSMLYRTQPFWVKKILSWIKFCVLHEKKIFYYYIFV